MPPVPSTSSVTGQPVRADYIHTAHGSFVDSAGRTLLLRGVNLSGATKAPIGQPSYQLDGFWEGGESGNVSFVGRPLRLDDGSADVHLARLRGWGYTLLRFPFTWEALEHDGPGKYDEEYMDYVVSVLRKCKEYGFKVYMDPHQDVWSRFSGGSGAPYWTLPACGINPRNFTKTQTAVVHCEYPSADAPDPFTVPAMIWGTNYGKLASQTLFTLFFAGRDFAPLCVLDGENIQDYLQRHFLAAVGALADRIATAGDLLDECVLGWDSMNEPFEGLVGHPDVNVYSQKQTSQLKKGPTPSPAQSFRLGMGQAQTLETWTFSSFGPRKSGTVTIDPEGARIWADPATEPGGVHPRWGWTRDPRWVLGKCIWAQHGVWDIDSGEMLRPDYFKHAPLAPEREVEFIDDYWRVHLEAFSARVRAAHPEAILFVAPPVFAQPPAVDEAVLQGRCCYSTHYYDGLTLITRHWNWFNADALGVLRGRYSSPVQAVKVGERAIRASLREQLGILKADADILGPYPTVIGEIGIPFDLDDRRAYGYTDNGKYKGDYSRHERALDASMNAGDGANALNWTIWNYCPDSAHRWGDLWNMEDLSIWSPQDMRPRAKEELRLPGAGASSATLVRRPQPWTSHPKDSTLSLATLSSPADADDNYCSTALDPLAVPPGWDGLYDFLTDGARAVRAFCRPYPTAVVGSPVDIQFDIAKATFTLTVRVTAEDAPQVRTASSADSISLAFVKGDDDDEHERESTLATEIYVPFVHFAADSGVARFCAPRADGDLGDADADKFPAQASPELLSPAGASSSTLLSPSPPRAGTPASAATALALDVRASEGRWAVDGQRLRWWYAVPAAGEAPREYTLEIRRAGGAIRTLEDEERARGGWCEWLWGCEERCVGDGCVVM